MPMITIDGKQHDTDTLSDTAKAQIANIQIVDQKISQAQQELAIFQTARNTYAKALQDELNP